MLAARLASTDDRAPDYSAIELAIANYHRLD
jgi:hypothetical protein